ncbi:MAG: diguanylate cyclase protein [Actinomycetia bacterium]|nr:diguanylate cyclase protein [Actinomycetes bacterium]
MVDRALLVAVGGAVAGLAASVIGVVVGSAVWGVGAGAAAIIAAAAGIGIAGTARQAEERLAAAQHDIARLHRELDAVAAILDSEVGRRDRPAARDDADDTMDAALPPESEHAFDPATGLYDERYFAVLVQQQVAAARRSLRPVSVVIFEIDGMQDAESERRDQALGVVGDVIRRTLRESDSACRLGDLMVGAILEDTPEAGAVWAAERVRGTLLTSPVGDALTLSAGVACYPSHALGAAELVQQAGVALEDARARGRDRVEMAPEAT